ncbi:hypothetical protein [Asticcacaulis sp. YBE204]|uniref:hypothetical protein n=1 Tax=Asticcacaulis sp. YBE204 TaxID=1282363 RepID=UPI0003C3B86E|nr:hypothetical protein [Asticcacaulis sp. YBE204]ESQ80979.1 hypothetical protein AEYBE204_01255 [Asticcacaulis sp. YBE204]
MVRIWTQKSRPKKVDQKDLGEHLKQHNAGDVVGPGSVPPFEDRQDELDIRKP